jgi:undecaprenyl-diphosphatase
LAVVALLGGFTLFAAAVSLDSQPYFDWDLAVSREFQSASWPGLDGLMRGVSLAGDRVLWSTLMIAAACLVLLALHRRREAAVLVLAVVVGQVLKIAVKNLIGRPRPTPALVNVLIEAKEIYSFPSGHTVHYVVFFGFIAYLAFVLIRQPALRWLTLAIATGLVLLVGPARIYLGAHWASDVLGGYLLGGAVLLACIQLYVRRPAWQPVRSDEINSPPSSSGPASGLHTEAPGAPG